MKKYLQILTSIKWEFQKTIAIICNNKAAILEEVGLGICVEVGPEVIAGSSRIKAGTAQKMVLNMLTTGSMIKIGKTYENFIIDLLPTNEKLKDRAMRIVQELAGVNASTALKTLLEYNWKVKEAVLMLQCDLTQIEAQEALRKNCGVLKRALASLNKIRLCNFFTKINKHLFFITSQCC